MLDFTIDKPKCVRCGACARDCPTRVIMMEDYPVLLDEEKCIHCQHCLTICPTGAVSILGLDPAGSVPAPRFSPEEAGRLALLMRSRRSVRAYMDEDLPKEQLEDLLQTALCAPTGVNAQEVYFHVVAGRERIAAFSEKMYGLLEAFFEAPQGQLDHRSGFMLAALRGWQKGRDRLLCHAPCLVVSSAGPEAATPKEDCMIAMTYLELYAAACGLGALWNGMMYWVLRDWIPELRLDLGIPSDHSIGYAMVLGRPAVRYKRGAQRQGHVVMME